MEYSVFIDESGNTGELKYKNNKWNFESQPYFALGAYWIESEKVEVFNNELIEILTKYDRSIGDTRELKSTANDKFKKDLLIEIVQLLERHNVKVYIDIANKKYKVIMTIVEYCFYPYYLENNVFLRNERKLLADYLYNHIDEKSIDEYIQICSEAVEEVQHSKLREYLAELSNNLKDPKVKKQINVVREYIQDYKEKGLAIKNIFPVKDHTNNGKEMSFLPNSDAYLNLIASISSIYLDRNDKINIYHDKQNEFSNCLEDWTEELKDNFGLTNINSIQFLESTQSILIQLIDYLTGNAVTCFRKALNNSHKRVDREVGSILKSVLANCNIVSTSYEQKLFFDKYDIKFYRTPVPSLNGRIPRSKYIK